MRKYGPGGDDERNQPKGKLSSETARRLRNIFKSTPGYMNISTASHEADRWEAPEGSAKQYAKS